MSLHDIQVILEYGEVCGEKEEKQIQLNFVLVGKVVKLKLFLSIHKVDG